ncbi:MAG: CBS domain-containing protein [Christensenellaceae bacterium]|nr:CBS domain-containing protein [Christensenellaceae bacterium]
MNIMLLLKPKSELGYVREKSSLRQAMEKMRNCGYAAIPVVDSEGRYVGTVREGDCLWKLVEKPMDVQQMEKVPLSEVIDREFNPPVNITVRIDELLLRVIRQNFVPVVDGRNMLIGIITRRTVLQHYYDLTHGEEKQN